MPMSNEQLVTEILGLLGQPVAIGMSISKDHHFVLLPIDDNNISILQGFQGSYTLVDWLAWRGIGLIPKASSARPCATCCRTRKEVGRTPP